MDIGKHQRVVQVEPLRDPFEKKEQPSPPPPATKRVEEREKEPAKS